MVSQCGFDRGDIFGIGPINIPFRVAVQTSGVKGRSLNSNLFSDPGEAEASPVYFFFGM